MSTVSIGDLISVDKIEPVAFHPYTSIVTNRLISVEYDSKDYYINQLEKDLIELFNNVGIQCAIDNKIVFACLINGVILYIGFKDWVFSIGFGMMKGR